MVSSPVIAHCISSEDAMTFVFVEVKPARDSAWTSTWTCAWKSAFRMLNFGFNVIGSIGKCQQTAEVVNNVCLNRLVAFLGVIRAYLITIKSWMVSLARIPGYSTKNKQFFADFQKKSFDDDQNRYSAVFCKKLLKLTTLITIIVKFNL